MINHQLKYLKSIRYERDKRSNKQRRDVLCCFIISILECRVGGEARYRGEGAEVGDGGEGVTVIICVRVYILMKYLASHYSYEMLSGV